MTNYDTHCYGVCIIRHVCHPVYNNVLLCTSLCMYCAVVVAEPHGSLCICRLIVYRCCSSVRSTAVYDTILFPEQQLLLYKFNTIGTAVSSTWHLKTVPILLKYQYNRLLLLYLLFHFSCCPCCSHHHNTAPQSQHMMLERTRQVQQYDAVYGDSNSML